MVLPKHQTDAEFTKKSQLVLQKHYHDLDAIGERLRELKARRHEIRTLHNHQKQPLSLRQIYKKALRRFVDSRKSRYIERQVSDMSRFQPLPGKCKILVAIRNNRSCPTKELRAILSKLGLYTFDTAILLPNDRETRLNLKLIENYVFYGMPSADTIRQILMKRAKLKPADEGQEPSLITSNVLVEEKFEKEGLLSIEDLVYELYLGGSACQTILNALIPFSVGTAKKVDEIGAKMRTGVQEDINELLPKIV